MWIQPDPAKQCTPPLTPTHPWHVTQPWGQKLTRGPGGTHTHREYNTGSSCPDLQPSTTRPGAFFPSGVPTCVQGGLLTPPGCHHPSRSRSMRDQTPQAPGTLLHPGLLSLSCRPPARWVYICSNPQGCYSSCTPPHQESETPTHPSSSAPAPPKNAWISPAPQPSTARPGQLCSSCSTGFRPPRASRTGSDLRICFHMTSGVRSRG